MYIDTAFYKEIAPELMMPEKISAQSVQYLTDLYASYQMDCEINMKSSVYNYDHTALHLFDCERYQKICKESDYLLFPSWGFVFSAKMGMPKMHWKNKYQWNMPILDIQDCGSLCVYHAMIFLYQLNSSMAYDRYTCCTIENTVAVTNSVYPEVNYVGLLSFRQQNNQQPCLLILHCEIVVEQRYYHCLSDLVVKLNHIAQYCSLGKKPYHIFMNHHTERKLNINDITVFHRATSSGFLYFILQGIQNGSLNINTEFIFIVDFDYQTQSCGILLIKTFMGNKT